MKITATIITLNEENNIAKCINSLSFVDEILVVDSLSTDKTVEIAQSLGARVISEKFRGYGQQKNFAADCAQNEWILNIDADEEVSPELKNEIIAIKEPAYDLYEINRMTSFCGKWIKHGGWYPDYQARFYNKSKARWTEPQVHERLVSNFNSQIGRIEGCLRHYSFPTIKSQIVTNLKYAKLGSIELIKRKNGARPTLLAVTFRPLGKFIECYIVKKGFLDGKEGFIIAVNAAHSMFMKYSMAYIEGDSDD